MSLKNAAPPPRPSNDQKAVKPTTKRARVPTKFKHIAEIDTVQFNKKVPKGTADGFAIMAVRLNRKIPDLITEGLELLEEKYGKV